MYDALLASKKANVQDSINCWLPPGTGLREEIDAISARYPLGFEALLENTEGVEEGEAIAILDSICEREKREERDGDGG